MSGYAVARLEDTGEVSDGRCPWRPGDTSARYSSVRELVGAS
jgi:hypothetical protein